MLAKITVAVCAVFAARGTASIVDAQLGEERHVGHAVAVAKPPAPAVRDPAALVARDMFCSDCTAVPPQPGDAFHPDGVLIATSIGFEPLATVRVPGSEIQGCFGEGDRIPGLGRIVKIGWTSIDVVDESNRHGTLSLLDPAAAGRGDAGAATPAPAAAADPFADRIKKINDHTFEVERALVRELVSSGARPSGARIVPVPAADGSLAGLRMYGASPGSLMAALGIKNGDVLDEINGVKITSANTLLDVYARIDQLNVVELDGTRAGKPLGITLRLR